MEELTAYRFSDTAPQEQPDILNGLTPEQFLRNQYNGGYIFGVDNLKRSGKYKIHGWSFDFRPFMKRYYVEQYDQISKEYAPNKTLLRRSTYGKIDHICERV